MIFPENRFRPPLYTYASMQSVLFEILKGDQALAVLQISKMNTFVVKETNITITEIELVQHLQNAILDDNEFSSFEIHHHFFGVEGELKHYILQASYLEAFGAKEEAASDKSILFNIVNSFKPLRLLNAREIKETESKEAMKKQREFFESNGQTIFFIELSTFLSRFSAEDVDNKMKLIEIKKGLAQFNSFARQVKFSNPNLDSALNYLWQTLEKDEDESKEFKTAFKEFLSGFNQGIQEGNEKNVGEITLAVQEPTVQ